MNGRAHKKDQRGSNKDRRRQKRWLLGALRDTRFRNYNEGWAPYGGDGVHVNCVHCGTKLDFDTLERDRIVPGGPYVYENIQPSCKDCNNQRGNNQNWVPPLARAA